MWFRHIVKKNCPKTSLNNCQKNCQKQTVKKLVQKTIQKTVQKTERKTVQKIVPHIDKKNKLQTYEKICDFFVQGVPV